MVMRMKRAVLVLVSSLTTRLNTRFTQARQPATPAGTGVNNFMKTSNYIIAVFPVLF